LCPVQGRQSSKPLSDGPVRTRRRDTPGGSHAGTVSLLLAVAGAVACRVTLRIGALAGEAWLQFAAAGFDVALVGGLADWFAVTALFRHPLGLPIPRTAILPPRSRNDGQSLINGCGRPSTISCSAITITSA
jgi:hypothetical protein